MRAMIFAALAFPGRYFMLHDSCGRRGADKNGVFLHCLQGTLRCTVVITTIFPRIYARTYYAQGCARVMSFSGGRQLLEPFLGEECLPCSIQ